MAIECEKNFKMCNDQQCIFHKVCRKRGVIEYNIKGDVMNKQEFFHLIGADPLHATANVVWRTLQEHKFVICKLK
jgi:hypothetical protein